jgi:hypothetical protein
LLNIAAVDVDRIARDMDFQVLQDNLEQITLCNIDAEIVSFYLKIKIKNFFHIQRIHELWIQILLNFIKWLN